MIVFPSMASSSTVLICNVFTGFYVKNLYYLDHVCTRLAIRRPRLIDLSIFGNTDSRLKGAITVINGAPRTRCEMKTGERAGDTIIRREYFSVPQFVQPCSILISLIA